MDKDIRNMVIDKRINAKFMGLSMPSIKSSNLPTGYESYPEVRLPRNKYITFRNWYLLMQVFVLTVMNKPDATQWDIEELLLDMAQGKKIITIKEIK